MVGMKMTNAATVVAEEDLGKPNPEDWTTIAGAAEILDRSRTHVMNLVDRGVLRIYWIGGTSRVGAERSRAILWVPEVVAIREAMRVLGR